MSSLFGSNPSGSSLFGNVSAPPQPISTQASSLFGSTQTSSPSTSTGGLFGRTTTSQPQQGSSLFSNVDAQSKPNPFPSLFGTSQPHQPSSTQSGSSLFAPASQPQQTSSLFNAPNSTVPNQTNTSSLFASQQPQQGQQPQQQVLGQTQQQSGQQSLYVPRGAQPAYFDSLLEKGKKRMRDVDGPSGLQDLPSLQLSLGDIAKRVRELGGAEGARQSSRDGRGADSRAHYLLAASGVNPGSTRRDLDSLAAQSSTNLPMTQSTDWEPDPHKYVEQLQQQQTVRMVQEGLERAQRRFEAYLEENADINWDLQRKKIYEHFGLTPRSPNELEGLEGSIGKGSFGHSTKRGGRTGKVGTSSRSTMNRSIFGQSGLQKSVIGTPGVGSGNATLFADVAEKNGITSTGPDDRYLREKQRKYADKIQALNQARIRRARLRDRGRQQEFSFPILQEFLSIENQPGGDSPKQIADAIKVLIEITQEGNAQERQYASEYLDELPNSARSVKMRRRIIDGSRTSLEKAFFDQLESLIARNPKEANIGGVPTAINKVRAYVRMRALRKDLAPDGLELAMMGEDYCWALIFYLLRSGLVKEAAEYVVGNAAHFKTVDRNIITFITAFAKHPDRRLEGRIQRDCNNVFSAMTKTAPGDSVDPYRIACYKIIGRCELTKRSIDHVSQGVEDWIWLQFNLAREVNRAEENAGDVFGLEEVQETINEIGQRHFAKGAEGLGGFGTYFHLQILGGLFENAVAYLYSYSYTVAVHVAIALDFYGLLRVSDFSVSETELLSHSTKDLPQLNFGRMIGYYTRDFRAGDVEAAVDYLALLCLNADLPGQIGKSQAALCHEALRELVLESREFARLLGDIRSDGTRIKGAIEERLEIIHLENQEDFLQTVTIQAASVADDNGRITDAVLLYHLSEDYDNVINIVNRALSESLSVDIDAEPPRLQPLKPRTSVELGHNQQVQQNPGGSLSLTSVDDPYVLAKNMISLYSNNMMYLSKIKPFSREACGILLRLSEAKSKVIARSWAEAYDIIFSTQLLPLRAAGNIPTIRNASTGFSNYHNTISRLVGPLLLWTIMCISRQRATLAQKQYEGGASRQLSEELLSAARDLMVFAGLIKYRLSEKVWEAVCSVGEDRAVY